MSPSYWWFKFLWKWSAAQQSLVLHQRFIKDWRTVLKLLLLNCMNMLSWAPNSLCMRSVSLIRISGLPVSLILTNSTIYLLSKLSIADQTRNLICNTSVQTKQCFGFFLLVNDIMEEISTDLLCVVLFRLPRTILLQLSHQPRFAPKWIIPLLGENRLHLNSRCRKYFCFFLVIL